MFGLLALQLSRLGEHTVVTQRGVGSLLALMLFFRTIAMVLEPLIHLLWI